MLRRSGKLKSHRTFRRRWDANAWGFTFIRYMACRMALGVRILYGCTAQGACIATGPILEGSRFSTTTRLTKVFILTFQSTGLAYIAGVVHSLTLLLYNLQSTFFLFALWSLVCHVTDQRPQLQSNICNLSHDPAFRANHNVRNRIVKYPSCLRNGLPLPSQEGIMSGALLPFSLQLLRLLQTFQH